MENKNGGQYEHDELSNEFVNIKIGNIVIIKTMFDVYYKSLAGTTMIL